MNKIIKNLIIDYDQMNYMRQSKNFQFEGDHISKGAQSIGFMRHEAVLLMKLLQTEPPGKSMNINDYEL